MSEKILVVDDDPATVRLVEGLLQNADYQTVTASDGLDAMVQIKREKPSLVILDIVMPEINGYDICYQLRFKKEYDDIPIILLTERSQEIVESISKKVRIDYLPKPVESKILLEKVKKALDGRA